MLKNKSARIAWSVVAVLLALMLMGAGCGSDTVPNGQVCWTIDPEKDPSTTTTRNLLKTYTQGTTKPENAQCGDYTVVLPDNIGYYGDEILPPNSYVNIPKDFVRQVRAATVPGGHVGVYCGWSTNTNTSDEFRMLTPGHYNYPEDMVASWPTGEIEIRTLSPAQGSTSTPGYNSLLDEYKANPNDPNGPCAGKYLCEASISKSRLKDSKLEASVDVDIRFAFNLRDAYARKFCEMRSPKEAVQTYILGPARKARSLSEKWTEDEFTSLEAQLAWESDMTNLLTSGIGEKPIIVISSSRRGVTIGSKDYQDQLDDQEIEAAQLEREGVNLDQKLANQSKEQQLAANQAEFLRQQQLKDAENQAAQIEAILKAFEGQPWQVIAVLTDFIQVNPLVNLDGSPVVPTPSPAPAP